MFAYGYINNDNISTVEVINNNIDIGNAEIVETKWKRIWIKEVEQGTTNIKAYDERGELID